MDQYQKVRLDSLDQVQEERPEQPSIEVTRASISQYRSNSPQTVLEAPALNGAHDDADARSSSGSVNNGEDSMSRSSSPGGATRDNDVRRPGRRPNVTIPRSPGYAPEQFQGSYFALWQHPSAHDYHSYLTEITTSSGSSRSQSANVSSSSLQGLDELASHPYQQTVFNRPSADRFESGSSNASTSTAIRQLRRTSSHTRSPSQPLMRIPSISDDEQHPGYPTQNFAALHHQAFPSPHRPRPLRTRSSHPSQHSLYSDSAIMTRQTRDRSSPAQASRTTSNTPASSPGLFSPRTSRLNTADMDEDTHFPVGPRQVDNMPEATTYVFASSNVSTSRPLL
jgi:hypothetical protein